MPRPVRTPSIREPSAWRPAAAGRPPCWPVSATAWAGRPTPPGSAAGSSPSSNDVGVDHGDGTTVFDGRLGHGIPTVVVVRDAVALWGAGSTFAAAYHRALFGHQGTSGPSGELDMLRAWLTAVGLDVVVVDLGSPVIEQAGVQRLQVQLLASSHDQGRPWDGDPMN